jgi:hypothetical protein
MTAIVVLGGGGHTGRRVVESLLAAGADIRVGARNVARAQQILGVGSGDAVVRFDATDPRSLGTIVEPGDTVVNCVGPYSTHGFASAEHAVAAGANYLDCSGEAEYLRAVTLRLHERAQQAGVTVLPGFGFESVPGHVTAALALDLAGDDGDGLHTLYACDPRQASAGTWQSALISTTESAHALRDGALMLEPIAAGSIDLVRAGRPFHGFSIGTTEPLLLPRTHATVRNIRTYLGGPDTTGHLFRAAAKAGRGFGESRCGRPVLRWLQSHPPTERTTRHQRSVCVISEVRTADAMPIAYGMLAGGEPYTITAELLGYAARSGCGRAMPGVRGPLEVFSRSELVTVLQRAGMFVFPSGVEDRSGPAPATRVDTFETRTR